MALGKHLDAKKCKGRSNARGGKEQERKKSVWRAEHHVGSDMPKL